jgi:hypothetical protein
MTDYANELRLGCHCGNVQVTFRTNRATEELPLRRCLCSYCTAHGNVYTSDPEGEVTVRVADPGRVSGYRNPRSISEGNMVFLVCSDCGVVTLAVSEIEGEPYAVVRVTGNCSPPIPFEDVRDMDYGDETLEARHARRKATWVRKLDLPPGLPPAMRAGGDRSGAGRS